MHRYWVAIAALCSGCSLALMKGGPKHEVVRYETRKQTATIRTVPAGGTVSDGHGPPRTSPTELEASYEVKLVSRERSEIYPIIGIVAAAVSVGIGGYMLRDREQDRTLGWVLLFGGMLDLISTPNRFASFRRTNERARQRAREELVPHPLELEVTWPSQPPQKARLNWPQQRFLTVVRPVPTTFDDTLIAWAEAGDRAPSPEGLFNLGSAYANRAKAGDAEAARKALDYLERYLKTDNVSDARRARVEELTRALGGAR